MKNILFLVLIISGITFSQQIKYVSVAVDSNTAISDSVDLGGIAFDVNQKLIGIIIPSVWTTANLTFQSYNSASQAWVNLYQYDGTELNYTAGTSYWIIAKPTDFAGIRYLKIRSGTAATPVAQADDRVLILVIREY